MASSRFFRAMRPPPARAIPGLLAAYAARKSKEFFYRNWRGIFFVSGVSVYYVIYNMVNSPVAFYIPSVNWFSHGTFYDLIKDRLTVSPHYYYIFGREIVMENHYDHIGTSLAIFDPDPTGSLEDKYAERVRERRLRQPGVDYYRKLDEQKGLADGYSSTKDSNDSRASRVLCENEDAESSGSGEQAELRRDL